MIVEIGCSRTFGLHFSTSEVVKIFGRRKGNSSCKNFNKLESHVTRLFFKLRRLAAERSALSAYSVVHSVGLHSPLVACKHTQFSCLSFCSRAFSFCTQRFPAIGFNSVPQCSLIVELSEYHFGCSIFVRFQIRFLDLFSGCFAEESPLSTRFLVGSSTVVLIVF